MNLINNLSVKVKIAFLIIIAGILLISSGVLGITTAQNLNRAVTSIHKDSYEPSMIINQINELMVQNLQMLLLAGYHDPSLEVSKEHEKTHKASMHLDAVTKNTENINTLWKQYLQRDLPTQEKTLANEWAASRKHYVEDGLHKALEIFKTGDYTKAQLFTVINVLPLFKETKGKMEKLLEFKSHSSLNTISNAQNTCRTSRTIQVSGISISLITFLIIGILVVKNIVSSLNKIQHGITTFFSFLNKSTNKAELININSKDEFGQMSKVINENIKKIEVEIMTDDKFVQDVQAVMNRVENGWFSEHVNAHTNNQNLQNLKQTINQALANLRANFVLMNNTLEEYCNYDYTKELKITNIEPNGVFDTLIKDINKLRDAITHMLSTSLTNGIELQSDAGSLKEAVESLSAASNEQAASLEETAAAMEEMTSNVQNNVAKSNEMATMAKETDSAAKDGASLAKRTSVAMTEIQTATNSINDAVAIIENIAFQTNILSLNAAVEAATAGEAGKGFAVVAQEVRNLANRSADAAKEIKTMAAQAAGKSNEGMNIATELTRGFEIIASKIAQTASMVQDVSNANREQMQGISQINTAVTQLDQMTQENAKIASEADAIANATISKAQAMVKDASSKEFVGKDKINNNLVHVQHSKPIKPIYASKPVVGSKVLTLPKPSFPAKDVWESF